MIGCAFSGGRSVAGRPDFGRRTQLAGSGPQEEEEGSVNRRVPPLNSLRAFEVAARRLSFTKA
ncbi:MAG: hypothetical protein M0Z28_32545, partial [Rhodospirillales bacterium]|nr:hypothetical protein [Rhodospirillales bacterium]